jgi:outer membrane receptor for ferrienterochelin and colicins
LFQYCGTNNPTYNNLLTFYKIVLTGILLSQYFIAQGQESTSYSLDSLLNIKISSASKYDQTTAEAPSSITILTAEDIRDFGWDNVSEALSAVRSLYVSDDRNYQYLGVRGFGRPTDYNNRVLILIDGHSMNEPIWGTGPIGLELQGLNIEMLERIEIIRGPSSSLYGNYAMQAIINFVFKEGRQVNGVKFSAEAGSFGHYQTSLGLGKRFSNGLDLSLAVRANTFAGQNLYFAEYDDSLTNFGIADHRDSRKGAGAFLKGSWKGFTLIGGYTNRKVYNPTAAFESVFNDPETSTIDGYSFAELQFRHSLSSKAEMNVRLWGNHYGVKGIQAYEPADGGEYREEGRANSLGSEVRLQYDLNAGNRLIVGGEFNQFLNASYRIDYEIDGPFLSIERQFSTFSFFAQDEFRISSKVTLHGGLRFDQQIGNKRALNPRLALIYHPNSKSTFKISYAQAFRAPSISELILNDSTFVLANPNLIPEKIRSIQIIWEQRIGKSCWATATAYHNQMIDLIDTDTDSAGYAVYQNLSNSFGTGIEGEFNFSLPGLAHFYSSAGLQSAYESNFNVLLTNSPVLILKSGISFPVFKHFRLSQDALFETGRLTVYDTQTEPFLLMNSQLLFDPQFNDATGMKKQLNRIRIYFRVRNLLNTVYAYPGGTEHLMPAIIQNGRNFIAKIQVTF